MNSTLRAKLMSRLMKKEKGFTLIELLVVIVIVGVLSGVAVPTFLNQIRRSRAAEAQSGLATISTASEIYRFDNGNYPPSVVDIEPGANGSGDLEITWVNLAPNFDIGDDVADATETEGMTWTATGNNGPYLNAGAGGAAVECLQGLGDQSADTNTDSGCNL
ncbi:MAG: prepilin-type N-terminal cleavage/methylation domain-containing protein [Cyanobacteria bacterium P01_E01_bin.34]